MSKNKLMKKLIIKYQKNHTNKGRCKHIPTCSNYGLKCYEKFSFPKATILTAYRILRCNPLSKKTYDPVPLSKDEKKAMLNNITRIYNSYPECFSSIIIESNDIDKDLKYIYNYALTVCKIYSEDYYTFFDTYLYLVKNKTINRKYKLAKKITYDYIRKN